MISAGTHNEPNRVAWIERTLKRIPASARTLDAGEQRFKPFCTRLCYVVQKCRAPDE